MDVALSVVASFALIASVWFVLRLLRQEVIGASAEEEDDSLRAWAQVEMRRISRGFDVRVHAHEVRRQTEKFKEELRREIQDLDR